MVAVLSATATVGRGREVPKDTPDQAAARAAVLSFADLLSDPDFTKAKSDFVGGEEELKLARNLHGVFHAKAKMVAAVLKAMPNEKGRPLDDGLAIDGLKRGARQVQVTIEGDTAMVGLDMKLKRVNGVWKVFDVVSDPKAKRIVDTHFPVMTQVMTEALPDIEAGKYKTAEELQAALMPKMLALHKAREEKARSTTKPAEK